jgi:hypothetical protein
LILDFQDYKEFDLSFVRLGCQPNDGSDESCFFLENGKPKQLFILL